jgi:hypothetical protein
MATAEPVCATHLPDFIAVGGFDGLGCLTDSCDRVSPPIDDILTTLKRGVLKQCSYTIGEATTASAELNQLYNPKPHWKDIISRNLSDSPDHQNHQQQ